MGILYCSFNGLQHGQYRHPICICGRRTGFHRNILMFFGVETCSVLITVVMQIVILVSTMHFCHAMVAYQKTEHFA